MNPQKRRKRKRNKKTHIPRSREIQLLALAFKLANSWEIRHVANSLKIELNDAELIEAERYLKECR
jgi:hypothetical protein